MKRLMIIGAGGFGREVLAWALDCPDCGKEWKIEGFLDANTLALEGYPCDLPILGDPATHTPTPDDLLVCAIGDPVRRLALCLRLRKAGGHFLTLIHPTAVTGPAVRIGEGSILCPGAVVTTNVTLGDFTILNVGVCVGHDVTTGDACTLSPHADLGGHSKLGEGVFLGTHADVLPGAIVGDYAKVGAGSVVLKKVEPHTTVVGVPARVVVAGP